MICKSTPARSVDRKGMPHPTQMAIVASAVNTWFAQARGHGIITMVDGDLQVRPYASDLFGVLIPQIAHVTVRSDQTALCAGCRDPLTPTRTDRKGLAAVLQLLSKRSCPSATQRANGGEESARRPGTATITSPMQ